MSSDKKSGYRKNFSLIITFIILMSVLFLLSLALAYRFSTKFIMIFFKRNCPRFPIIMVIWILLQHLILSTR
jgi:hypothetical protein